MVRPLEQLSFGDGLTATLCEIELLTGRSHQIRAHLASIGHPLMGDSKYADRKCAAVNAYARRRFGLSTQLLHACRVEFAEAVEGSGRSDGPDGTDALGHLAGKAFEADPPARFNEILQGLGGRHVTRR